MRTDELDDLYREAHLRELSHDAVWDATLRRHTRLGIPTVIVSAIIGTSAFTSLAQGGNPTSFYLKLSIGLLGVCAATLSGVQTFLNDPERAGQHREAAGRYADLRRRIQLLGARLDIAPFHFKVDASYFKQIDGFNRELAEAEAKYPRIPAKYRAVAEKAISAERRTEFITLDGAFYDLFMAQPDHISDCSSITADRVWNYEIKECTLEHDDRRCWLHMSVGIVKEDNSSSECRCQGQGTWKNGSAYVHYTFIDENSGESWDGVMLLHGAAVGGFSGIWATTGVLSRDVQIIGGQIQLTRRPQEGVGGFDRNP